MEFLFILNWIAIRDNERRFTLGGFRGKRNDLTGETFGRLLVINRVESYISPNGQRQTQWNCLCNCGNTIVVSLSNLKNKNTTSCGCYKREILSLNKFIDMKGRVFGKLTVIQRVADKIQPSLQHKSLSLCQCECGNETVVAAYRLRNGETQSCGCIRESIVSMELKLYFKSKYNAIPEYKAVKNPNTNHYLYFDIYLPIERVFIEIHGEQHYTFNKHFHKREGDFETSKFRDNIKKKFAKKNGTYIEIDLRKTETSKEAIVIIERILNEL